MNDLQVATEAARAGGRVVREWMGRLERADFKGEVNPVTEADRQAEEAILEVISRHRPDDAVLAEERGGQSAEGGRRWLVDPLDGTVNFLHGVPHIAVSVALYEDEKPLAGVVLDVFREELFRAARGEGATLDGRAVSVSDRLDLSQCLLATGFPYDRREHAREYAATLGELLARARGVRRMGTAALDLAWVAAGRYDGFWEFKLAQWDVAAGLLLITEAGGTATDQRGEPARPGDPVLVASNGRIHEELRRAVTGHLPAHMRS